MKRLSIKVYGRVQGVFFRQSTQVKARQLGVVGWVRNEPDGSVAMEAQAEEDKLKDFLGFCQKGPPASEVEKMEVSSALEPGGYQDFDIK